jgi:NitT/TauT family transport system ATP-binding protein
MLPALKPVSDTRAACIRAERVRKTFSPKGGQFTALSDISLDVYEGEFLSIVGPSGCGKSTLLRCIAGLMEPSEGQIVVRGRNVDGPVLGLGIVFQRDLLLDWRTVLDNILLANELGDRPRPDAAERARELLAKVDLEAFANRYPWELSGGMRQRVAICRALLNDPPILLMDEPFGALDAFTRDELNSELQRIWMESGKTVVFITHSITEAVFLSDRIIVMGAKPGRIIADIRVDLPRPRALSIRDNSRFGAVSNQVRQLFTRIPEVPR